MVRGHDAVIHAAALPDPAHNPAHVVFANNLMATFNAIEAAVRFGVPRFVNLSSETVPGHIFPERPFFADYVPVDEDHPVRPQDPYALAKHFGEQLMDAATRRSELAGVSVRPTHVQWEGNYERNLQAAIRDPFATPSPAFFSYIDVYDLADALRLAAESDRPGHDVVYIASPDNFTGRPLAELVRHHHGDAVELREPFTRSDASGITTARAAELLGYAPTRSWRDYLDETGTLRPRSASGSSAARPACSEAAPRWAEPVRAPPGGAPCSRDPSAPRAASGARTRRCRRCRTAARRSPRRRGRRGRRR